MKIILALVLLFPLKAFSYAFVINYKKLDNFKIDMRLISIREQYTSFDEKTILLHTREGNNWSGISYYLNIEEAESLHKLLSNRIGKSNYEPIYKFRAHMYFDQSGKCYFNIQPMNSSEKYKICLTEYELTEFLSHLKNIPKEFIRIESIIVNEIINRSPRNKP